MVKNEYTSNREQLFNFRNCGLIRNDDVYLKKIEELINEEMQILDYILNCKL